MNENNLQKLSDEQLDRLTENIFRSVVLTDDETKQIADSPRLWWHLQSRIATENAQRQKRRFFFWNRLAATSFGVLALVFGIGIGTWFYNSGQKQTASVPEQKTSVLREKEITPAQSEAETAAPVVNSEPAVQPKTLIVKSEKKSPKLHLIRERVKPKESVKTSQIKTEVATNFIPLSYLPAGESGQIVRVKVPRSMMVSLGVTTNTERSSELVNAEVVIADDGGARAIRFLK